MASFEKTVRHLVSEQEAIQATRRRIVIREQKLALDTRRFAAWLQRTLQSGGALIQKRSAPRKPRRKPMSVANRRAVSRRMKKYWSARRTAKAKK